VNRLSLGLRYMLASALFFSVMSVLAKQASVRLATQQVVLVRAIVSLVLSYATLRHLGIGLRGNRTGLLVLRGLLGTLSLSCLYYSLSVLPLADATVIQHTAPVLTALCAALTLGERLSGKVLVATVASLGGVALMVRPPGGDGPALDPVAVGVALVGALAAAAVYTLVRRLREHDDPHRVVFYFPLVAVPVTRPTALPVWQWHTPLEWLILVGVGVSTQLAQVAMTRGLALEPAGRATSMNYMQIVFNMAFGVVLFAEWPAATTVLGAAIVVGATAALAWSASRAAPAADG
jgi:drug/metabolite transporter (DMT)-like permease